MKSSILALLVMFIGSPCWSQGSDVPSKQEINELVQKADEKVTNFEAANQSAKTLAPDKLYQKVRETASTAHAIIAAIKKNGPSAYALVGLVITLDDVSLNAANGGQAISRRAMANAVRPVAHSGVSGRPEPYSPRCDDRLVASNAASAS
jgi:hypothetical protein